MRTRSENVLHKLAYVALVFLGIQALFFSTVFVPADAYGRTLLLHLVRKLPKPYEAVSAILFLLNWMVFSLASLTVLVWALVRFRTKTLIVPSLISIALGAYIFLCYVALFASGHD